MARMATTQRAPRTAEGTSHRGRRPDLATQTFHSCSIGALTAVLGVSIALILAAGTWALAPHGSGSSPEGAIRLAAGMWLKAHHVSLTLDSGPLTMTPLGLVIVPSLLLYAGGRQLTRMLNPQATGDVARAIAFYALTYGLVAAIVAGSSADASMHPAAWRAFIAGSLMAAVIGGIGMLRSANLLGPVWTQVPFLVRQTLAASAAAVCTLVAASAALTSLALATNFPEAVDMFSALQPDLLGGMVLALLCLSLVPNLVIWALSFTVGAGFDLGTGGSVSPRGIEYDALPVFPPLASMPPQGQPGALVLVVLAAPLVAGCVAGLVVHRRLLDDRSSLVVALAGASGVVAGVMVAALSWLSAGSVAAGSLSSVGPAALAVGAVTALEVGFVAAMTAWETQRRGWSGRLPNLPAWLARLRSISYH